jgi:putative heme-binding domain-containing protein
MNIRNCCFVIGFVLAGFVATAQVPRQANPLGNGSDVVQAGRTLFNKTCTGCHGVDAGEGSRGPALAGERRFFRLSDSAIFGVVKNGILGTSMPGMGLTDADAWRIVAFIRNLRGTASDNEVPGDVEHGMKVFKGKGGCLDCHMIRGEGGAIGPDLSSIGAQVSLTHLREELTHELPIPPGYTPVHVVGPRGEVVDGIARNDDDFSIQILDEKNKLHLYDRSTLKALTYARHSLMPHDFDKVLTPEEFQDLLAMLSKQTRVKVHIAVERENEAGR